MQDGILLEEEKLCFAAKLFQYMQIIRGDQEVMSLEL